MEELPGKKVKLAIFYQMSESWANVRTVWKAASTDPQVDVLVVVMPFIHASYEWRSDAVESYLQGESVPYVLWQNFDISTAGIDVVFFTSPYDSTRLVEYQFTNVKKHVRYTAYIPYGIEIGGGEFDLRLQYGEPAAKDSDFVFVRSESLKEMYRKHCPSGDRHVVVSGYPRFDELANFNDFTIDPELLGRIGERLPVLWNTHFTFDVVQWSTFDLLGMDIVSWFAQHPRFALIFRPHPLLWRRLKSAFNFTDADVMALKKELSDLGIIVDERADSRHVFAASKALISDVGSFLMDYLVTGKPILYLRDPLGLGLNEEGDELVSNFGKAETIGEVGIFLSELELGEDPYREKRLAAIPRFVCQQDGFTGQRIVEHVKAVVLGGGR